MINGKNILLHHIYLTMVPLQLMKMKTNRFKLFEKKFKTTKSMK